VLVQDLSEYFVEMKKLFQEKGVMKNRIRFMLQDVIDLWQRKWVPRRNDATPKTMKYRVGHKSLDTSNLPLH
jgi:hypothetical protein